MQPLTGPYVYGVNRRSENEYGPMQQTECIILTMGCEKTTNDAIKFS